MKIFRIICFLGCILIIGFHIYSLDYENLSFKTNDTHYLGIVAMLFLGFSILMTLIKDRTGKE